MTAYSMPVLPDCVRCNGPVVLDIDGDGPREVCVKCGLSQDPVPPRVDRAEMRQQVAVVKARRPLLCPSCLGRRCWKCHVAACECPHTWKDNR